MTDDFTDDFSISKRGPLPGRSMAVGSRGSLRPSPRTVLSGGGRGRGRGRGGRGRGPEAFGVDADTLAHEAAAAASVSDSLDGLLSILTVDSIADAIESGDLASILDWLELVDWLDFEDTLRLALNPRLSHIIQAEGARSYGEVRLANELAARQAGGRGNRGASPQAGGDGGTSPPKLPPTTFGEHPPSPGPRAGIYARTRFDMTDPFALRSAEQYAAERVRQVSASTRNAIREAVADSFRNGITGDALARRLRNTIGLTSRQARAVENYSASLLRSGMDEDRVDVLTRRYYRRARNRRAETIARTEIMQASNHGRMQGWLSAADHGMLDLNQSAKEWITAPHLSRYGPPCPSCGPMDGKRVMGVETPFRLPGGKTIDMPPAHPNCRCTAVLHPPEPPEDWDPEYPYAQV